MKKKPIYLIVASLCLFCFSASVSAKALKKKDFDKLLNEDRTFYLVGLEFAYNTEDYTAVEVKAFRPLIESLDTRFLESFPIAKMIASMQEKFEIEINKKAFELGVANRESSGFFTPEPEESNQFTYYRWKVPSRNNRLVVSVYLFKVGNRIRLNKAQIELRFLVLNKAGTAYEPLLYHSERLDWKTPEDIYTLVQEHALVK